MNSKFKEYQPVAEAFAKLLHPFAEVVIHDLAKDCIVAIYNPISKREVGDPSYFDGLDFGADPDENVIGPSEKINYDGRRLKSISIVLRNDKGKAVGSICVNMDISVFEKYQNTLQIFLSNNDSTLSESRQAFFKDSVHEQINIFIENYCRENNLSFDAMSKNDKQDLIFRLKENGAFNGKNATSYIARILNISRATVYNYLKESEAA